MKSADSLASSIPPRRFKHSDRSDEFPAPVAPAQSSPVTIILETASPSLQKDSPQTKQLAVPLSGHSRDVILARVHLWR